MCDGSRICCTTRCELRFVATSFPSNATVSARSSRAEMATSRTRLWCTSIRPVWRGSTACKLINPVQRSGDISAADTRHRARQCSGEHARVVERDAKHIRELRLVVLRVEGCATIYLEDDSGSVARNKLAHVARVGCGCAGGTENDDEGILVLGCLCAVTLAQNGVELVADVGTGAIRVSRTERQGLGKRQQYAQTHSCGFPG